MTFKNLAQIISITHCNIASLHNYISFKRMICKLLSTYIPSTNQRAHKYIQCHTSKLSLTLTLILSPKHYTIILTQILVISAYTIYNVIR